MKQRRKASKKTTATSELKYLAEDWGGHANLHYYGINAISEDGLYYFQVCNDRDNEQAIEWTDYNEDGKPTGSTIIPLWRNASISCLLNAVLPAYAVGDDSLRMNRQDTLPAYAQSSLRLTPAQAADAVEGFLAKAGLSDTLAIAEICLMSNKDPLNGVSSPTSYAYNIDCTRLVQGIPGYRGRV